MDDVFERDGAPVQLGMVVEEAFGRSAFEEQAPSSTFDDEVEAKLGGASSAQQALSAAPLRVAECSECVERATAWGALDVASSCGADAEDARFDVGRKRAVRVEFEAARVHEQLAHASAVEAGT